MTRSIPELVEALRQDAMMQVDPRAVLARAMQRAKVRRARRRLGVAVAAAFATAVVATIPLVLPHGTGQPIGPGVTASTTGTPTTQPSGTIIVQPDPASGWGRLFYLPGQVGQPLRSWSPVDEPVPLMGLSDLGVVVTGNVSPDGNRLAWVENQVLKVANVDGSGRRDVLDDVDDACVEPTWLPDGQHVTVRRLSGSGITTGYVDVADGTFHPFTVEVQGCHVLWAADGKSIAFAGEGGRIMIAAPDGTGARPVPGLGEVAGGRRSYDPMSLSSDGRLLALRVRTGNSPDGDAGRDLLANEIVDTTTGETLSLPLSGEMVQAYFRPTGGLVVRVRDGSASMLILFSTDLNVADRATEPAALADSYLLGWAPLQ